MRILSFIICLLFYHSALAQFYYGAGAAVNLENAIQYKNGVKTLTGSLDPSVTAVNAPIGSVYYSTNGKTYIKSDSGLSTNWKETATVDLIQGNPYAIAYFDSTGALQSAPSIEKNASTGGIWVTPNYVPLASGTNYTAINRFESDITASNYSPSDSVSVMTVDSHIDRNGGGNDLAGNIYNISSSLSVENNKTYGNLFGINQNISQQQGTVSSIYGINQAISTATGSSITDLYVNNASISVANGSTASNLVYMNAGLSGNVTNNYNGLILSYTGNAQNSLGANISIDGNASSMTGVNVGHTGTATGGTGFYADLNGNYDNANGFSLTFDGLATSSTGFNVSHGGISGTFMGANIYATGSATSVTGLNISLDNISSPNRKNGLTVNGGNISANSQFTTTSNLPQLVDSGNFLTTQFTVSSGAAITGTDFIANNLAGLAYFQDDYTGSVIDLGYSAVGYVGQIAVESGKTADSVSMALAGASWPVQSTGGTLNEFNLYNAVGGFSAGGTINISTASAYKVGPLFNGIASNQWAFRDDSQSENFVSKLSIDTTSKKVTNSDVALEIGSKKQFKMKPMTNAEKSALTGLEGSLIANQDDKVPSYFNGTSWVNIATGSPILSLNGLTNQTQTFATGSTGGDFNISSSAGVHTLNIPDASGSSRGLLTQSNFQAFNNKVDGQTSSVDSEIALFSGVGGKTIKRATGTGVAKVTNGVFATGSVNLANDQVSGVLNIANGGTNNNSFTNGQVVIASGSKLIGLSGTSNGQVLGWSSGAWVATASSGGSSVKYCAATVAANGTISNESGDCFDGNCSWNSGNGRTSCFILAGFFSGTPNCVVTPFQSTGDHRSASIVTLNSTDLVYRISAGDNSQQNQISTVTCIGN